MVRIRPFRLSGSKSCRMFFYWGHGPGLRGGSPGTDRSARRITPEQIEKVLKTYKNPPAGSTRRVKMNLGKKNRTDQSLSGVKLMK